MNARCIACLALASLIPLSEVQAQDALGAGTRVRVTAPDIARKPITGIVSSADASSITIAVAGESPEQTIPMAGIRRLEIHQGRSHSPLKGMGTGLLVGTGIGIGIGVGAAAESNPWVCEGGQCVLAGALGGALWGTVIGGLLGAAIGHDQWEAVVPLKASVNVDPLAGGFGLAVSMPL